MRREDRIDFAARWIEGTQWRGAFERWRAERDRLRQDRLTYIETEIWANVPTQMVERRKGASVSQRVTRQVFDIPGYGPLRVVSHVSWVDEEIVN